MMLLFLSIILSSIMSVISFNSCYAIKDISNVIHVMSVLLKLFE